MDDTRERSGPGAEMDLDEFRRVGHAMIEWAADYLATAERYPVLSRTHPGELTAALPAHAPERGEPMDAIFGDFKDLIVPAITHWNSPMFFAYFAITGSGPGILGELLAAALNVNGMLWRTSPAVVELEDVALGWLRDMLGLPAEFDGTINDTASSSTLYALAAAREAIPGLRARELGLAGRFDLPRLRIYASLETHSSIEKAAITLGIGQQGLRKIPTDSAFRMDPTALRAAIAEDLAAGWRPFAVVATVGTTSTTSVDPVPAIADICGQHGLWLHVDAAYGGSAAILPELRQVLDGCERADSLVTNPHKWLATQVDCSVLYCRKPDILKKAFSLVPEYLRTSEQGGVKNLMDYGNALGRRFRALKLWMVLRYFGQDGLRAALRGHIALARELADSIEAAADFELLAPLPFATVVFRYHPLGTDDEAELEQLNTALLERLNAGGEVYLSHTKLRGQQYALRASIGNLKTEPRHVRRLWDLLQHEARALPRRAVAIRGA
jgi:aromatic-L-amino-acid decarboxylase